MIEFKNVVKKYKQHTVLSDFCLHIPQGNMVVLIGSSGCGKTTTLKMINRLIKPTSGTILINGQDAATLDVIALRRSMGYVIQQTGLFPHMTVRENIELIPKLEKHDPERLARRTLELMEMVGLEGSGFLDRYPAQLSGGQQQRIGVARAFALDPDIILMDEPFSSLDPVTRGTLQDELTNLQDQLHKTIVFVTHDMDEAVRIADKICIMDKGKILQYDTPEEILKNPHDDFVADFVGRKRIWSSPAFIRAEDIMIDNPVTCSSRLSLVKCLDRMHSFQVDTMLVVETKSNRLLGIVSAKQLLAEKDHSQPVSAIMGPEFVCASPESSILEIMASIEQLNISSIPIINEDQKLLGLVTKSSLFTTISQQYLDVEEV